MTEWSPSSGKGYCPGTLLPAAIDVDLDLTATLGERSAPVKISQYALHGTLGGIVFGKAPCAIAGGRITVNGSATEELPGRGTNTVQMHDVRLTLLFGEFSPKCEPAVSTIRLDGSVHVEDTFGTTPFAFDAILGDFGVVQRADAAGGTSAQVSGTIDSTCAGGPVAVATAAALHTSAGEVCPTAGALTLSVGQSAGVVEYTADGNVQLADGTLRSCVAESLRACAP